MKLTARTVPPLAFVGGALLATTAVIGGPIGLIAIVGLVLMGFAYMSWRRDQPAQELRPRSGRRALWLLGGGAGMLGLVAFAPQDGPDGLWFVLITAIIAGITAVTVGVLYGIAHLTHRQA